MTITELFQAQLDAEALPDGDADLDQLDFPGFAVPPCVRCGGVLKRLLRSNSPIIDS